jgi:ubiquinone/menaquinone biosynthesis C-methylase UbiE
MKREDEKVKQKYDKLAKNMAFYYLTMVIGRTTENSIFRKKAINVLGLNNNSVILDAACGTGYNFKLIERYLGKKGKLVGIDISSESLRLAKALALKNNWNNIELLNMSITDYEPKILYDAVLCTYAKEIIPHFKSVIDMTYNLLKPNGIFSMIGMKLSSQFPYKYMNFFLKRIYQIWGVDVNRDIIGYVKSKFKITFYEERFFGFYYILGGIKLP